MPRLPLRGQLAREYVHGQSGPVDRSNGSLGGEEGHFGPLVARIQDHSQGSHLKLCIWASPRSGEFLRACRLQP